MDKSKDIKERNGIRSKTSEKEMFDKIIILIIVDGKQPDSVTKSVR